MRIQSLRVHLQKKSTKKIEIMTTLENKLANAQDSNELLEIVNSIKKQEINGFKNALARHLEDAFWYCDLIDDVKKQIAFMLNVCTVYNDSFKELN